MGKIKCEACKKKCKKQAVKAQDKYYHPECFKCSCCNKRLSLDRFYRNENQNFCEPDYHKLFGKWCCVCSKVILNDIISAKGRNYHVGCLKCNVCSKPFKQGDTATFMDKEIFCAKCFEDHEEKIKLPVITSFVNNKETNIHDNADTAKLKANDNLNYENILKRDIELKIAPMILADSTTNQNIASPDHSNLFLSPGIHEIGEDKDYINPSPDCTLDHSVVLRPHNVFDGYTNDVSRMKYGYSPFNSTSSTTNRSSRSSKFGIPDSQFYNMSYLERVGTNSTLRRESSLVGPASSKPVSNLHFHRPDSEFSYRSPRQDMKTFIERKPQDNHRNKGMKNMMNNLNSPKTKSTTPASDAVDDGTKALWSKPDKELKPIERLDWPSPPDPAAAYPEMLRNKTDLPEVCYDKKKKDDDDENENENEGEDGRGTLKYTKLNRGISELQRIAQLESGAASVFLKDLQNQRYNEPDVDPRNTSRDPSAEKCLTIDFKYRRPRLASPRNTLERSNTMRNERRCLSSMTYNSPTRYYSLKYKSVVSANGDMHYRDTLPMHSTPTGKMRKVNLHENNVVYDCEDEEKKEEVRDPVTGLKKQSLIKVHPLILPPSSTHDMVLTFLDHSTKSHDDTKSRDSIKSPDDSKFQEKVCYTLSELQDAFNNNNPMQLKNDSLEEYLSEAEFESLFKMKKDEFKKLQPDQKISEKRKYFLA